MGRIKDDGKIVGPGIFPNQIGRVDGDGRVYAKQGSEESQVARIDKDGTIHEVQDGKEADFGRMK